MPFTTLEGDRVPTRIRAPLHEVDAQAIVN
jgi:hypothetical protein